MAHELGRPAGRPIPESFSGFLPSLLDIEADAFIYARVAWLTSESVVEVLRETWPDVRVRRFRRALVGMALASYKNEERDPNEPRLSDDRLAALASAEFDTRLRPDAYLVRGDEIIVFEIDDEHTTTAVKLGELAAIAEHLAGLGLAMRIVIIHLPSLGVSEIDAEWWFRRALCMDRVASPLEEPSEAVLSDCIAKGSLPRPAPWPPVRR